MKNFQAGILLLLVIAGCRVDDITSPSITLLGEDPAFLRLGSAYVDAGATAIDVEEGEIADVDVDLSAVFTDTVGTYAVQYLAFDKSDNLGTRTRTVHVFADGQVFTGTYDVEAVCGEDTLNYQVNIAESSDSVQILIDNFAQLGTGMAVAVDLSGNTFSSLNAADTVSGIPVSGSGALDVGSTGLFEFSMDFTVENPGDTLDCSATFTRQ